MYCYTQCPQTLQQATTHPHLCWRLLDTQASPEQSLVGSLLLSPGSWCTRCCLCPPRVYFPALCKFWQLYGGVNGDLLQEGLYHTQVCCTQNPSLRQATAGPHLHRRRSDTVLSQALWGSWVQVHTSFVWALWASLAGMGFDSKCEFAPPTILLGLLLCQWMWGIPIKN